MKRLLGALAAVVALLAIGAGSANAITGGRPDGDAHPYVGVMITYDQGGHPLWACSGTLMSSTVFLTAGHCILSTDGVRADHVGIWFDSGPITVDEAYENHSCTADVKGFPCSGADATSSDLVTLSGYSPDAFVTHDLGVVELEQEVDLPEYGALPDANTLDALKTQRGRQDETFATVGYGMQESFSGTAAGKSRAIPERLSTTTHLVQIDGGGAGDFGVVLSDNASTGGMCYGDSGGPSFLDDPSQRDVVVAVSSGLTNDRCEGTSLSFRLDRRPVIDWLAGLGVEPPPSSS